MLPVVLFSFLILVGHLYGFLLPSEEGLRDVMRGYSASFFFLISLGAILRHPANGFTRMLVSISLGGWLFRRMLLVVFVIPIVIGLFQLYGEYLGYYDSSFRIAIMMVFIALILVAALWFVSQQLNNINLAKQSAEETLQEREESYRNQFVNSSVVMLLIDPETAAIVDANAAASAFYGYSREQLLSMQIQWNSAIPPKATIKRALSRDKYRR
jgi:PAS domain-containing protein